MKNLHRCLLIATVVAVGWFGSSHAAEEMDAATRWHEAPATVLDVKFGDSGFHARWAFFSCDCGDLLVRIEQTAPDSMVGGELLLVGGKVLLGRGGVARSPDLLPVLQAPALMAQVAMGLLQRALPQGPASVTAERAIDLTERNATLAVDTGFAAAEFTSPWRVTGRAWPGASGRRRFELDFTFTNPLPDAPPGSARIGFSGGQDYVNQAFPLVDETPLEGWKLQWLSRGEESAAEPEPGLTLGGLRVQAANEAGDN